MIFDEGIYSDIEPCVTFSNVDGKDILSVKASGIFYNRDEFPRDSYEQAAKRVYALFAPIDPTLPQPDLSWEFSAWGIYPDRKFKVGKSGIDHNYDLDTWHHWFVERLTRLVRKSPS